MENIETKTKLEEKTSEQLFEEQVLEVSKNLQELILEVHKKIVWQEDLIKGLLIWLFWKWHILLEWVPWLAKTLTVDTLSKTLKLWFNRIQFTPDLLPSDLIWTEIYNQKTWDFLVKKWPIFNNFILADEINRAPSKVQSALLEAMAEKHITIWKDTFVLDMPFVVLATQNPIEQSWTYKLPEAELDRFMLKLNVNYQTKDDEKIMYKKLNANFDDIVINKIFDRKDIFEIQETVAKIYVSDNIYDYVTDIIDASRNPEKYWLSEIKKYISYWVSPRWWLSLISASKVIALMEWRTFVIPEDIKKIWTEALAHRLVLSFEALANDITSEEIIKKIFENVKVI